jgi:maltose alpha-D-glucosyltransferase/alpha-amylase
MSLCCCFNEGEKRFNVEVPEMVPDWLPGSVIYQIYPQSFNDSNGDGIGDLPGIEEKLDYVASLGVDAIWLNPCFESPFFDAGYDVTDYYKIAPRYGTNADMARLVEAARGRGLRVILDLVPGHTSIEHPWFKESSKGPENEYGDCYIWKNRSYDRVEGPTEANYLKSFFPEEPALNYGYAKPSEPWQQGIDAPWPRRNRAELRKIMAFWLDMGVSGFRVDMAFSLIKNDPGCGETNKLWKDIRSWLEKEYPDAVLLAEWSWPERAAEAGFHLDFMIHFQKKSYKSLFFNGTGTLPYDGACYFDDRGEGTPWIFIREYLEQWRAVGGRGYISLPTANHDFQRLVCGRRDADRARAAWVFLMTQPGVPTIYYGDEIGMRFLEEAPTKEGSSFAGITAPNGGAVDGERAGTRTPMQWAPGKNAGFSSAPENALYLPVDKTPDRPDVESQEEDPDSMLNFVRLLLRIRKENPALGADSEIEFINHEDVDYPLAYLRSDADSRFLVAVNPSGKKVGMTLDIPVSEIRPVLTRGAEIRSDAETAELSMEPFSYVVTKLSPC